jgi:hypothetical protein
LNKLRQVLVVYDLLPRTLLSRVEPTTGVRLSGPYKKVRPYLKLPTLHLPPLNKITNDDYLQCFITVTFRFTPNYDIVYVDYNIFNTIENLTKTFIKNFWSTFHSIWKSQKFISSEGRSYRAKIATGLI